MKLWIALVVLAACSRPQAPPTPAPGTVTLRDVRLGQRTSLGFDGFCGSGFVLVDVHGLIVADIGNPLDPVVKQLDGCREESTKRCNVDGVWFDRPNTRDHPPCRLFRVSAVRLAPE